jgi:DNA 3'-phosphatase
MSSIEARARLRKEDDDDDGASPPWKKKAKSESPAASSSSTSKKQQQKQKQSSLLQFFGGNNIDIKKNNKSTTEPKTKTKADSSKEDPRRNQDTNDNKDDDDVIIPCYVPSDPKAEWSVVQNCMLVRSMKKEEPRTKAAAFDVDGTLLVWRTAGWPSKFEDYELWNLTVLDKLRELHDHQGYKLVFLSNQGAIRGAFTGKKATFVKSLLEWLAHRIINRPVHIVLSTNKKLGYHKPNPGMWQICEQHCNRGIPFNLEESFFVGDSVGDDDPQGGVDEKFAQNVSKLHATKEGTMPLLKFYTPTEYFGISNSDKRSSKQKVFLSSDYDAPPSMALQTRKALLGGYLQGPIMLLLAGVQGSGKSTFSEKLLCRRRQDQNGDGSVPHSDDHGGGVDTQDDTQRQGCAWVHLCQDTINKGKPGNREAVEKATRQAIRNGCSVIIDRMHLDKIQRKHFVDIAMELHVPVHILVFRPPKDVIAKRVLERSKHPGGVEGEKGMRMALASLSRLQMPTYHGGESFALITCLQQEAHVHQWSTFYRQVLHPIHKPITTNIELQRRASLSCGMSMPCLVLGTMNVGKRVACQVVSSALDLGWRAVDTAPTYKNEDVVGESLQASTKTPFVIVKVPKRVTQPAQVREELEASLEKLKIKKASLLLLHWPCDVIHAGTLKAVWEAMEQCVSDGMVRSIGVSNFSVDALRQLLPHCTIIPSVNQVERHPLLPQMELLDFCINQGIVVQAHTCLGQGKLLTHQVVVEVAKEAKLTPAQVLVQWNVRHGVSACCKAASKDHQEELLRPFHATESALRPEHMKALDDIKEQKRFVAPPFMMVPGAAYSWRT